MQAPAVVAVNSALANNGSRSAWTPVVDGKVLKEQLSTAGLKVPAILGSTTDDGSLFILGQYGAAALRQQLGQADYDAFLTYNFGPLAGRVNETYSLASAFNGSTVAAMATIVTEVSYECPAYRALRRAEANGVPVWTYRFAHQPTCAWYFGIEQTWLPALGATHTSEIPFVFNFTSGMPPPSGNCTFTAAEQALSHTMSRAWTDMAAFGRPAEQSVWPSWTSVDSKGVVFEDAMNAAVVDYTSCSFWDDVNEELNEYWRTR